MRHSGELHGMVSSTRAIVRVGDGHDVWAGSSDKDFIWYEGGSGGFLCSEAREVSQHLSFWQS